MGETWRKGHPCKEFAVQGVITRGGIDTFEDVFFFAYEGVITCERRGITPFTTYNPFRAENNIPHFFRLVCPQILGLGTS